MFATTSATSSQSRLPLLWLAYLSTVYVVMTSPGLGGVVAGAAAVLVTVMLAMHALAGIALGHRGRSVRDAVLRECSRRTGVLRQCDPDAAGRPRPRAPSPFPSVG